MPWVGEEGCICIHIQKQNFIKLASHFLAPPSAKAAPSAATEDVLPPPPPPPQPSISAPPPSGEYRTIHTISY